MRVSKLLYAMIRFVYAVMRSVSWVFLVLGMIYIRHLGAILVVPMLSLSSRGYGSLRGLCVGWFLTILCIPSFWVIQKKVFSSHRIFVKICSIFLFIDLCIICFSLGGAGLLLLDNSLLRYRVSGLVAIFVALLYVTMTFLQWNATKRKSHCDGNNDLHV